MAVNVTITKGYRDLGYFDNLNQQSAYPNIAVTPPVVIPAHNQLTGLNGDLPYQHLDAAEYNELSAWLAQMSFNSAADEIEHITLYGNIYLNNDGDSSGGHESRYIYWGDDTYIHEYTDDVLRIVCDDALVMTLEAANISAHYPIKVDTINELTGATGVTIDGGLLKDNRIGDASNYWDYAFIDIIRLKDPAGTTFSEIYASSSDVLFFESGSGNTYFNTASVNNLLRVYNNSGSGSYVNIYGSAVYIYDASIQRFFMGIDYTNLTRVTDSAAAYRMNFYHQRTTGITSLVDDGFIDIRGYFRNDAVTPEAVQGIAISGKVVDNTDGSEDAKLSFYNMINGVLVNNLSIDVGGMALNSGATVNTIETTLTDDDTHLPTSGAVYDYVASATAYWDRSSAGVLSPDTPGDDIELDGNIYLNTDVTVAHTDKFIYWGDASDGWDTFIGEQADDVLSFSVGGTIGFKMYGTHFRGNAAAYVPRMASGLASSTVPGFTFDNDTSTGIGKSGTNETSIISGGGEILRIATTGILVDVIDELTGAAGVTIESVKIEDGTLYTSLTNLTFEDNTTGPHTLSDLISGGAGYWDRSSAGVLTTDTPGDDIEFEGNIYGSVSSGPSIRDVASSNTVPNIHPRKADTATGIGSSGTSYLDLIANSNTMLRVYGSTGQHLEVYYAMRPITTGNISFGGTSKYWGTCYVTQINFTDVNTHISQNTSQLYFYDTTAGGVYLNDLKSKVGVSGTPVNDQIAVWTNSSTIEGHIDFTWSGTTIEAPYIQTLNYFMIDSTACRIEKDNSDNMKFTDAVTGSKTLAELAIGADIYGTPLDDQIAVWVNADAIEGTSALSFTLGSGLVVTSTGTVIAKFDTSSAAAGIVEIDNGGATADSILRFSANGSAQFSIGSDTGSGDFRICGGGGTSLSALQACIICYVNDHTVIFFNGSQKFETLNTGIGVTGIISIDGINTQIWEDGSNELSFKDSVTGTKTLAELAATAGGGGDVSVSGTPVNDQIAVWTNASTIEGSSNLTYAASTFNVTGTINASAIASGITQYKVLLYNSSTGLITYTDGGGTAANYLRGDGTWGVPSGSGGISWSGSTANGIGTYVDVNTITAETNLTFNGSTLAITGTLTASAIVSGVVYKVMVYNSSTGAITYTDGVGSTTNFLRGDGTWAAPSGSGSPGGSDTYVQFNDSSAFGGSINFTWDDYILQVTNTAAHAAWSDYPTVLPARYSIRAERGSAISGSNNYNGIVMHAQGAISYDSYAFLGVKAITTIDNKAEFNLMLSGAAGTDWETVFSARYDSIYYWKASSTSADIRHGLVQNGTSVAVWGWDDSGAGMQFQTGTSFSTAPAIFIGGTNNHVCIGGQTDSSTYELLVLGSDVVVRFESTTDDVDLQVCANSSEDIATLQLYYAGGISTGAEIIWKGDDNDTLYIQNNGSVGIKVSTAGYIYLPSIQTSSETITLRYTSGGTPTGEVTYPSSDKRLKKNIEVWKIDALNILKQFEPKQFEWKNESGRVRTGWIAQEGLEVIPDMFPYIEKSSRYALAEFEILPYYHKAIQQLDVKVETNGQKIKRLEERVEFLESQIN